MSKKKPQKEAALEGKTPPAAFSEASAAPGETNAAAPGETNAAAPGETNAAAPGETNAAAPGETTTAAPGETTTAAPGETNADAPGETNGLTKVDIGFLLGIMLRYNTDKVWINDKGEVFVEENLANLSVKQQKEKLKVYTKRQLKSLKAN